MLTLTKQLVSLLDQASLKENYPLSGLTTLGIGGPAQYFYTAKDRLGLIKSVQASRELNIPLTIIGSGSNILINDKGIKGLVVRNMTSGVKLFSEECRNTVENISGKKIQSRWESDTVKGNFKGIEFKDLDYSEVNLPRMSVHMESGVILQKVIYSLISEGVTGLQWYSGIPGTIGGAVYNNIHGGSHFIAEVIDRVEVIKPSGDVHFVNIGNIGLDYDKSCFHKSKDIILSVFFDLYRGDISKAKITADEWKKRKRVQPRNSAGCTFRNISTEEKDKLQYPTTSTGYIVDVVLGMLGYWHGDAAVSDKHGNFIINKGQATASDYLSVLREVQRKIQEETGLKIRPEIALLGFEEEEIQDIYQ